MEFTNIEVGYLINVLKAEEVEIKSKLNSVMGGEEREQYETLLQVNSATLEKLTGVKEGV